MPDEVEAEAIRDAVREDLERQLAQAQERLRQAEAREKQAREDWEKTRPAKSDFNPLSWKPQPGSEEAEYHRLWGDPGRDPASQDPAVRAAHTDAWIAQAEVDRLRQQVADLPPTEDIWADAEHGDNIDNYLAKRTPEDVDRLNARRTILRTAGLLLTVGGLFLFFLSLQQPQFGPPAVQPPASPADEPPISGLPVTGSSFAFLNFTIQSGECPIAPQFGASFLVETEGGALTMTQGAHVSTGTLDPTTGKFNVVGPDQAFGGFITGTGVEGTYTDTTGGCTTVYVFDGQLLRPLGSTALANFEFLNLATGEYRRDITGMEEAEVIVGSPTVDMTAYLPIDVNATAGGRPLFHIVIGVDPNTGCKLDTSACSGPVVIDPALLRDPNVPIQIIATGSGGERLAESYPNGGPPAAPAGASQSAEPSGSTGSPPSTTPPTTGGGPNLPLAAGGVALVVAGLALAGGGALRNRMKIKNQSGRRSTPGRVDFFQIFGSPNTSPTVATSASAAASEIIKADVAMTPLVGRAWKETAHETSGSRTAFFAGAALLLLLVVGGATAVATGLVGGGPGVAADPSQSETAEPSTSEEPGESLSAEPSQSEPVAAPAFPELADVGLQPPAETNADALEPVGAHSLEGVDGEVFPGSVNMVEYAAWVAYLNQSAVEQLFNATTFDCTNVVDGVLTTCASGNPIEPGPLFVAAARLAEPIPHESTDGLLVYSLVLDADGDPSNNFEAQPPFTNDFFQGTDRWYELTYTPQTGWFLSVDRDETISDARVAIMDDLIVFFVPMAELTLDAPGYRLTTFVSSDASFAPETSGGDFAPGPPDADFELAEPTVGGEAAAGFVVRLGDALGAGDTAFLFDRLHSATLDRYGAAVCQSYVAAVVDPANDLVPGEATGPESWEYVTDALTTTVAVAYAVEASGTLQGRAVDGVQFHVAMEDGTFRWFTDCGAPAG